MIVPKNGNRITSSIQIVRYSQQVQVVRTIWSSIVIASPTIVKLYLRRKCVRIIFHFGQIFNFLINMNPNKLNVCKNGSVK